MMAKTTATRLRTMSMLLGIYWAALLTGTHWPRQLLPEDKHVLTSDKLLHFSAYLGLAFLLTIVVRLRRPAAGRSRRGVVLQGCGAFLVAWGSGLFDEVTQPLVGRDFEWFDWFADGLGAACGVVLAVLVLGFLSRLEAPAREAMPSAG